MVVVDGVCRAVVGFRASLSFRQGGLIGAGTEVALALAMQGGGAEGEAWVGVGERSGDEGTDVGNLMGMMASDVDGGYGGGGGEGVWLRWHGVHSF